MTPATSVATAPVPKSSITLAVVDPAYGCAPDGWGWRTCRRPGVLSGASTTQPDFRRTRLTIQTPTTQNATTASDVGLTPPMFVEGERACLLYTSPSPRD